MDGPLEQVIALTSHGNAYLLAPEYRAAPTLAAARAFWAVRSVEFARYGWVPHTSPLPSDAPEETALRWLRALFDLGATRLAAAYLGSDELLPGQQAPAAANAVTLGVIVELPHSWEVWAPYWEHSPAPEPGHSGEAPQRPWVVHYAGRPYPGPLPSRFTEVEPAAARLRASLVATHDFALTPELGLGSWAGIFSGALAVLAGTAPLPDAAAMLLPGAAYPEEARRLLAAANAAWVFGGMGSWNDIVLDPPASARYGELSAELYEAVRDAILIAANAPRREGRQSE